jgi:hypothetical protein
MIDLDTLQQLLDNASPGPWQWYPRGDSPTISNDGNASWLAVASNGPGESKTANAEFIVASHNAMPDLIIENKRLRAFIMDLAEHGTRFDLNPTVDSCLGTAAYVDYITRIDSDIRSSAKSVLRD